MFIELITAKGEKVTARIKDARLIKVEKVKSAYYCHFLIGSEELYLDKEFEIYNVLKKENLLCN
jgi:hypothetical protein